MTEAKESNDLTFEIKTVFHMKDMNKKYLFL